MGRNCLNPKSVGKYGTIAVPLLPPSQFKALGNSCFSKNLGWYDISMSTLYMQLKSLGVNTKTTHRTLQAQNEG